MIGFVAGSDCAATPAAVNTDAAGSASAADASAIVPRSARLRFFM